MKQPGFQGVLIVVVALLLWLAPVLDLLPRASWLEQQRLFQIAIGALCALALIPVVMGRAALPRMQTGVLAALYGMLVLGVASSLMGAYPVWALTEVALFTALFAVLCWMGQLAFAYGEPAGRVLVYLALAVVVALLLWFISSLVVAFVIPVTPYPKQLLHGFSNIRFAGQFQTLTLPLLALPLWWLRERRLRVLVLVLLVLWWLATLAGGSRGPLVSLLLVMLFFAALGGTARRWSQYQFFALSGALAAYLLVFVWLAKLRGIADSGFTNIRLSSAGRIDIWRYCWEGIVDHPWLGLGPMHFAGNEQFRVFHPHNAPIQIAYEWGVPAAALFLALVVWVLVTVSRRLWPLNRDRDARAPLRVGLAAALLAGGIHSWVSGLLVMPYPQLWLVLLGGCLWGLLARERTPGRAAHRWTAAVLVAVACCWLIFVAVRDFDRLGYEARELPGFDGPRFWQLGAIREPDHAGNSGR